MTEQIEERLIFEDTEIFMASYPPLPKNHPRFVQLSRDELDAKMRHTDTEIYGAVFSTACWRRYIGTWQIKEDKLYLMSIVGIFRLVGTEPLLADWFTGLVRVPRGRIRPLRWTQQGSEIVWEDELHFKIEIGMVIDSYKVDNRNTQFNEWKLNVSDAGLDHE